MNKKVIIYGFGRMGLTHYSIINSIQENTQFTFVERDSLVRFLSRKNINATFISNTKNVNTCYDYVFVCTPPMSHVQIAEECIFRGDKNIFIEKPFGGVDDNYSTLLKHSDKISIGYVMRYNPIIQWLKNNLNVYMVKSVKAFYFSNTIELKPKGWRNSKYSGVINEMGSHIIDIFVYILNLKNPKIHSSQILSVVSDIDDIVNIQFSQDSINYELNLNWVNKDYRKPVFGFEFILTDGSIIKADQQKVICVNGNASHKLFSNVDANCQIPYYLRGVEFSMQVEDFINRKCISTTVEEAVITRKFIQDILKK